MILLQSVLYALEHGADIAEQTADYILPLVRELPSWCILAMHGAISEGLKKAASDAEKRTAIGGDRGVALWQAFYCDLRAEEERRKDL